MFKFFKNNSLSLVFLLLFLLSFVGQSFTGLNEYNKDRKEDSLSAINFNDYLQSGHFLQATFENWESEFLQMVLFVVLTISLRQKGSSESKKPDGDEEVDKEPSPRKKNAPWPVKKGGFILRVYKHSLSLALFILFLLSFCMHLYGSMKDENEQLLRQRMASKSLGSYIMESRFWFESFQNWQSEFLSVFAIVVLSIYLRQKGSPQSKPVDAPHFETGE